MEGKDPIKDLFSEKLSQLEVPVRPEIWSAVSSQIGAAAPAAAGLSIVSKIIIGVSVAASVSVGAYFITKDKETENETQRTAIQPVNQEDSSIGQKEEQKELKSEGPLFNQIEESNSDDVNDAKGEINESNETVEGPVNEKFIEEIAPEPLVNPDTQPTVKEEVKEPVTQETSNVTPVKEPVVEESEQELVLFNTFTPNNDGVNDELMLNAKGLSDFNLVVLDRSNKVVYQTNDPDFRWNGMGINNEMVPAGMYVYYVTAKDSTGKAVSKYSSLQIIK